MSIEEPYNTHMQKCVYIVEATSYETLAIWERFCSDDSELNQDERYTWKQPIGWLEQLGKINGRPICITITIIEMNGQSILFWDGSSQLMDYKMADEWFAEHLPHLRSTNAMNMHNAIHEVDRKNKEKIIGVSPSG